MFAASGCRSGSWAADEAADGAADNIVMFTMAILNALIPKKQHAH